MLTLIVTLFLTGAALTLVGLRGRRVGDHPFCRACGFDLFGLPAGATRCSECGGDLTRPRATIIGTRVRRRRHAFFGAIIALAACAMLVPVVRPMNWQRVKPMWWLVMDADGRSKQRSDDAFAEISRRIKASELSNAAMHRLVTRILNRQSNSSTPWNQAWGDRLAETRGFAGGASDEEWTTFLHRAIEPTVAVRVRPRVRHGDLIPMYVDAGGPQWRGHSAQGMQLDVSVASLEFTGLTIPSHASRDFSSPHSQASLAFVPLKLTDQQLTKLRDGPQKLRSVLQVRWIVPESRSDAIAPLDVVRACDIELLPSDQASSIAIDGPVEEIREAITVGSVEVHGNYIYATMYIASATSPLSFEVFVQRYDGGPEIEFGWFTNPARTTRTVSLICHLSPEERAAIAREGKVKLILRPSDRPAAETMDIDRYWSGPPIVFDKVSLAKKA